MKTKYFKFFLNGEYSGVFKVNVSDLRTKFVFNARKQVFVCKTAPIQLIAA